MRLGDEWGTASPHPGRPCGDQPRRGVLLGPDTVQIRDSVGDADDPALPTGGNHCARDAGEVYGNSGVTTSMTRCKEKI